MCTKEGKKWSTGLGSHWAQHCAQHRCRAPSNPERSWTQPAPHQLQVASSSPCWCAGITLSWQLLSLLTGEFLGLVTLLLLTEAHSNRSNLQNQEAKKARINAPTFPPGILPPRCCLKTNISLSRSAGKSKLRLTVSQITHQCRDQI